MARMAMLGSEMLALGELPRRIYRQGNLHASKSHDILQ
jgi:hypothetical protein